MDRSRRAPVSRSLQQQLKAYALAASAAGVSALALSPQADASVAYTKAYKVIEKNGIYGLDLNHDGVIDFIIHEWPLNSFNSSSSFSNRLMVRGALGNPVMATGYRAAALNSGASIGPGQVFISGNVSSGVGMAGATASSEGSATMWGPWANVKNRYLGLKFKIDGKTHYGWARLNVEVEFRDFTITATLTGYAYETVAGKEILAGQKFVAGSSSRSSLGELARGTRDRADRSKP